MDSRDLLFSVIIPVYNRENYIAQAIESVLAQTYQNFELIVCDDGSTDRTVCEIEKFSHELKLVHSNRRGPGGARNAAAAVAKGAYLSFLDSDDMWAPQTLEIVKRVVVETNVVMVWLTSRKSASFTMWKEHNPFWHVGANPFEMRGELSGAGGWAAISSVLFREVGGFLERMPLGEDNELLYRLWNSGPVAHITSPELLWYRTHENQSAPTKTGAQLRKCGSVIFERWRKGFYGGVAAPDHVNRCILTNTYWQLGALAGATARERFEYLHCCIKAVNFRAVSGLALPRHILRAIFKR